MQHHSSDERIAVLAAIGGLVLGLLAFRFGGFLAVGFVGLLIGYFAVRIDLEKEGVGGGFPSPHLYARQIAARESLTAEQQWSYRASIRSWWRPLIVAKTISVGLVALSFAGYFFL
jgi:hypothetical protein